MFPTWYVALEDPDSPSFPFEESLHQANVCLLVTYQIFNIGVEISPSILCCSLPNQLVKTGKTEFNTMRRYVDERGN